MSYNRKSLSKMIPNKIINKTRKAILVENQVLRKSPLELAVGLMFHKKLKDTCMIFDLGKEKKVSFHMFFVFFPIDIIFLDGNKRIVDMKENFMPFTIYNNKSPAKYAVELPEGTIKKTQTRIGDEMEF